MAPPMLGAQSLIISEASIDPYYNKDSSLTKAPAKSAQSQPETPTYKWDIVWRNVIVFIYLHLGAIYAMYLIFTSAKIATFLFGVAYALMSSVGVTAGAHRLWAHRCYKAKWPLRVLLMIQQTAAFQNHIHEWVRDHRVHHKFSETDADPHNAKRGFFFSHMGWLMVKKHNDVKVKGKTIDMSDIEADPICMFQKKVYAVAMPFFCFALPAFIPWYYWNETAWNSWYIAGIWRFTVSVNGTWLVNSAAHIYGTRPYDKDQGGTDSLLIGFSAIGEGWHNYHHTFPWDYKAAELGNYRANISTAYIDFFALIGWAYDLKVVSKEMIQKRINRTGDGTHASCIGNHNHDGQFWGWDDKDMAPDDKCAIILNPEKKSN